MIAKILPGWLETSAAVLLPHGARRLVKGVSASKPRRLRGPRSEEPTRPTDGVHLANRDSLRIYTSRFLAEKMLFSKLLANMLAKILKLFPTTKLL